MTNERYLGDGVYASLDEARQIILRTVRHPFDRGGGEHWIALEPEVFEGLIRYAFEIGWSEIIRRVAGRYYESVADEEYARDEEDKERIRASKEGFPDE